MQLGDQEQFGKRQKTSLKELFLGHFGVQVSATGAIGLSKVSNTTIGKLYGHMQRFVKEIHIDKGSV